MHQATGSRHLPLEFARSAQRQWTSQSAAKEAKHRHHGHQQDARQDSGQYHVKSHFNHDVTEHLSATPIYLVGVKRAKFPNTY